MKKFLIILGILIILLGGIFFIKIKSEIKEIPKDYIAKFVGDSTYTYIYKIKNGHANYGFKYINTDKEKILNEGQVHWTDDVFGEAKKNNAYNYVVLNNGKIMKIEKFMGMFLMN